MKKSFILLLIVLLLVSMTACGEYRPPLQGPEDGPSDSEPGTPPDSPGNPEDDPDAFTVSIRYNGQPYIPKAKDEMKAQWTDGFSFYVADFGTDGVARVSGLDGDYQVTLKGLPEGYLYNPNAYVATNDKKNIVIDIYKPIRTSGYGTGMYDCIEISKTGVYRVQLTDAEHKVFFQYAPSTSGTYSVESWVSTAEGNYNPMVDVYTGSVAYKTFSYTLNDGGISSGYTQNFKHIVEIADEQISTGGQAVFTFAVHADSKNGIYPLYVDIAIQLNGSFSLGLGNEEMIIPTEDFIQTPEYDPSEYTFKWAETTTKGVEGRYEYDGSMFKLWPREEGGDGYYHVYDAETGTYGEILYAKISQPHRFTELAFTHIEDPGNKSLTVYGTENHKLFIQGLPALLVDQPGDAGMYFCILDCPCLSAKNCYGVCGESCTSCHADCRRLPDDIVAEIQAANGEIPKRLLGYASFTNSDGVYAVTEEIRHFLQGFSVSQRYFADGQGWVESNPTVKVDATEEDQWLFACGYYVKK